MKKLIEQLEKCVTEINPISEKVKIYG